MKYYPHSAVIDVEVWNKPGDLTGDLPLIGGEGQIVKNYAKPGVSPLSICNTCRVPLGKHGWLPSPVPVDHETAHLPVDPNTGKPVAPRAAAVAESAEGTEAAAAVAEPAPAPEAEPQPGLVIHPGNLVDKKNHQAWFAEPFKQAHSKAE